MIKKAKNEAKSEEALVHAQISNPIFVRKTLLESAILGAEILKGYENIKKLEVKKANYRNQVKTIIRELRELIRELETEKLPKVPHIAKPKESFKEKFIMEEVKEREIVQSEVIKKPVKFTRTHSDVLNEEIRRLQERIDKL
ncbi:MAG: hypothetical protein AABX29_00075 [Nanoarchaeota archaeon]